MNKNEFTTLTMYFSRQTRYSHPEGDFDNDGIWFASEIEQCECCENLRVATAKYPYSSQIHYRSFKHVCNLNDIDPGSIKKEARRLNIIIKNVTINDNIKFEICRYLNELSDDYSIIDYNFDQIESKIDSFIFENLL